MSKGLNLHKVITSSLNCIVPTHPIILKVFLGMYKDEELNFIAQYQDIATYARIVLQNNQYLQHRDTVSTTEITKKFYIDNDNITGLNRNISTAGDFIIWNNLYYKINEVKDNFKTGWVCVIGTETVSIDD